MVKLVSEVLIVYLKALPISVRGKSFKK